MRFSKAALAALSLGALLIALPAFGQDDNPPAVAARIAWISGGVSLEAQGADYWTGAPLNYTMVGGDRIFTGGNGHAAIQSGGTDVRLWGGTDVTLTNLNEQYEQLGVAQGSVRVRVFDLAPQGAVEVDTPNGAVIIQEPGDYRVNVYPQQASLVEVYAGSVQISAPGTNQEVDQGEAVQLYGDNPVEVGAVDMPPPDGFDSWSADRDRHIMDSPSARYVSRDMPGYDDLDDYGEWTPDSDYGPMWFPRNTPPGWQPYTTGYWAYVQPWGYTWEDSAPWGYAPFHYGRWVQWRGRWGWVPGPPRVRPVYAPAFVAFVGGGPGVGIEVGGGGVAAWFPLGVAEPYVPWYRCSPEYVRRVNVTNVNITVIHNVTIVNNYNVFIRQASTARTVNDIHVNNIRYVNRTNVVAMRADQMSSGARVQTAAIHLNPAQRQQLARAQIAVARPPAPPPAHPAAGPRQNISRPVARPVLVTTHGRAAATPTANQPHFTPSTLPKPKPATQIQPARRAVVPNTRPAQPKPSQPAPAAGNRPGANQQPQPAPGGRVVHPQSQSQGRPETRPPAQQPVAPAGEQPQPRTPQPQPQTRPMQPAPRPQQPQPQTRPEQPPRPEQPQARPTPHPEQPQAKPQPQPKPENKKPEKPQKPDHPQ